jgi:hypothetical protein
MRRLEHRDRTVSFTRRALFVSVREADAGAPAACALLRSIMSQGIRHDCLKQLELDRQVLLRILAEVVDHLHALGR